MIGVGIGLTQIAVRGRRGGTAADVTAPTVQSVAITSTPFLGDTYELDEVIEFTVTFSEIVVRGGTGGPVLPFDLGGSSENAAYVSGSSTAALVFQYTVVAGDVDTNGISVGANALSLGTATLKDMAGNDANLAHSAVAADADHKVQYLSAPSLVDLQAADDDGASSTDNDTSITTTLHFDISGLLDICQDGDEIVLAIDGVSVDDEVFVADVTGDTVTLIAPGPLAADTYTVTARIVRGAVDGPVVTLSPDLVIGGGGAVEDDMLLLTNFQLAA